VRSLHEDYGTRRRRRDKLQMEMTSGQSFGFRPDGSDVMNAADPNGVTGEPHKFLRSEDLRGHRVPSGEPNLT
jgi:hypothetical protein